MKQTIRIGSFDGIEVGAHWSVAVILAYFAWGVGAYVLPTHSGHPDVADWVAGVIAAVLLLGCLLAHEMSHCLVARHNDVQVRSITLFAFGGISQLEGEAHTAGADFRIAAVGPSVSLALAVLFGATQAVVVAAGGHGLLVGVLSWLWEINLLLGVFNLIPAAPLDGGRVLRAALWQRSHDRFRASMTASRAGRVFAVVLIVLGVLAFGSTGSIIAIWPLLIGLFIYFAARGEEQYALVQSAMATLTAGQVMTTALPSAPNRTTVADVATLLRLYRGDVVAVVDDCGRLTGIVTAQAVNAVPLERRPATTADEIAIPLSAVTLARPEEPMSALLERIASKQAQPALVLDANGRVCGTISSSDIQRAVALGAGPRSDSPSFP
ncbi:MAG: site-2 protease family protein [Acidimicrobiales bacterium]|jgi:Zn-dependent protease